MFHCCFAIVRCHPGLNVTLPPAWSFATETEVYVRKPALAPVIDAPKLKLVEASEDGTMSGNQGEEMNTPWHRFVSLYLEAD